MPNEKYAKLADNGRIDGQNFVRNGGFWFAQRQVPGNAVTYSNTSGRAIAADGWGITNENASATYQRTDTSGSPETGLASQFYGNFVKTTSTGKLVVSQVIEGLDVMALRGRTVRVQCWLKQIVASAPVVRLGLAQLNSSGTIDTIPATFISAFGANGTDPTLGTNVAYIAPKSGSTPDNGTITGNALSCTLSSSWQRFGAIFDVPSNCKNLVVLIFGNAQLAATNGFAVAQVSLTQGFDGHPEEWCPMAYDAERDRVFRYYQKTFPLDTAPAQTGGLTGALRCIVGKAGATALACQFHWRYITNLRVAAGTFTTYNPSAGNAQARRTSGTPTDQTATAVANSSEVCADITATGDAGGAVGDLVAVHATADAEL